MKYQQLARVHLVAILYGSLRFGFDRKFCDKHLGGCMALDGRTPQEVNKIKDEYIAAVYEVAEKIFPGSGV